MIAVPILAIGTAVAVLWSMFKYQTAYVALIESLPPQFLDGLSSKFAFPEYVLRPSTPLSLQAEYVRSQIGFCVAAYGVALLCSLRKTFRWFDHTGYVFWIHHSYEQIMENIPS
jgi:hypothetical protein